LSRVRPATIAASAAASAAAIAAAEPPAGLGGGAATASIQSLSEDWGLGRSSAGIPDLLRVVMYHGGHGDRHPEPPFTHEGTTDTRRVAIRLRILRQYRAATRESRDSPRRSTCARRPRHVP